MERMIIDDDIKLLGVKIHDDNGIDDDDDSV
jgi:hypothetical protein